MLSAVLIGQELFGRAFVVIREQKGDLFLFKLTDVLDITPCKV